MPAKRPLPDPAGQPPARRLRAARQTVAAMVSLAPDAAAAVTAYATRHGLSRSLAIHQLVRLGANLPPLDIPPFNNH